MPTEGCLTGGQFQYTFGVAGSSGRAVRGELILSCDGYEDSGALQFEVQPGWLFCEAELGTVTVEKRAVHE
jgi:hypothetical protein